MVKITSEEINVITKYIYNISGISLDEKKAYLLESRLNGIIQKRKLSSFIELYRLSSADRSKTLEREIIDAITTNETLFFRDKSPFEMFQYKIMPDLIDKRSVRSSGSLPLPIRIWSAACSTGQEVYSLAIILKELLTDTARYNIKILGTDISDDAIARASYGKYNKFEIERGLSDNLLRKYFSQNGDSWKINDNIRAMALFQKINLMQPLTGLGRFDVIFCRNVAIYFCLEDRKKLFEKITTVLAPDGYLIVGSTESLSGISPNFEPKRHLRSVFYQLKSG